MEGTSNSQRHALEKVIERIPANVDWKKEVTDGK